jgi:tRNA(adenine34) deaminase
MSRTEERQENIWALAFAGAEKAAANDEVPVGAVLVSASGEILSVAGNETIARNDPSAHAEMLVIREGAGKLGNQRLEGCDLYVTLEPCAMCAAAISFARIRRLYFAASDPKGGAVENGVRFFSSPTCHHKPEVYGGIRSEEAGSLLRKFFSQKRD